MLIRRYEPRDRAAVRAICCDTADAGQPVENFFSDRELVADLVTSYYTDFEPACAWVAEDDGQVVGYSTGSLDTWRWRRITMWRIALPALLRAIGRGVLWRRQTWQFLRGTHIPGQAPLDKFPAHVHVNVRAESRGQSVGPQLLERFEQQVRDAGLKGIHANVRTRNQGGRKFFEHAGFAALSDEKGATVIYGKTL